MIIIVPGVGNGGFPAPDWDSGWVQKDSGVNTYTHNLGSMNLLSYVRYSHNSNGSDNRTFQVHGDEQAPRIIHSSVNNIVVHHSEDNGLYWNVLCWILP